MAVSFIAVRAMTTQTEIAGFFGRIAPGRRLAGGIVRTAEEQHFVRMTARTQIIRWLAQKTAESNLVRIMTLGTAHGRMVDAPQSLVLRARFFAVAGEAMPCCIADTRRHLPRVAVKQVARAASAAVG